MAFMIDSRHSNRVATPERRAPRIFNTHLQWIQLFAQKSHHLSQHPTQSKVFRKIGVRWTADRDELPTRFQKKGMNCPMP